MNIAWENLTYLDPEIFNEDFGSITVSHTSSTSWGSVTTTATNFITYGSGGIESDYTKMVDKKTLTKYEHGSNSITFQVPAPDFNIITLLNTNATSGSIHFEGDNNIIITQDTILLDDAEWGDITVLEPAKLFVADGVTLTVNPRVFNFTAQLDFAVDEFGTTNDFTSLIAPFILNGTYTITLQTTDPFLHIGMLYTGFLRTYGITQHGMTYGLSDSSYNNTTAHGQTFYNFSRVMADVKTKVWTNTRDYKRLQLDYATYRRTPCLMLPAKDQNYPPLYASLSPPKGRVLKGQYVEVDLNITETS